MAKNIVKDVIEAAKSLGEPSKGQLVGEGHLGAMARLGLKELRNAVNPSREGVADSEIGIFGTLTQGEIAEARGGPGSGPEQEEAAPKMTLNQLMAHANKLAKEAENRMDRGQEKTQERGGLEM